MASWEGCVCARQYTNGFLFPFRAVLLKQKREISKVVVPKKLGFIWINRFFHSGLRYFPSAVLFYRAKPQVFCQFSSKTGSPLHDLVGKPAKHIVRKHVQTSRFFCEQTRLKLRPKFQEKFLQNFLLTVISISVCPLHGQFFSWATWYFLAFFLPTKRPG